MPFDGPFDGPLGQHRQGNRTVICSGTQMGTMLWDEAINNSLCYVHFCGERND